LFPFPPALICSRRLEPSFLQGVAFSSSSKTPSPPIREKAVLFTRIPCPPASPFAYTGYQTCSLSRKHLPPGNRVAPFFQFRSFPPVPPEHSAISPETEASSSLHPYLSFSVEIMERVFPAMYTTCCLPLLIIRLLFPLRGNKRPTLC